MTRSTDVSSAFVDHSKNTSQLAIKINMFCFLSHFCFSTLISLPNKQCHKRKLLLTAHTDLSKFEITFQFSTS